MPLPNAARRATTRVGRVQIRRIVVDQIEHVADGRSRRDIDGQVHAVFAVNREIGPAQLAHAGAVIQIDKSVSTVSERMPSCVAVVPPFSPIAKSAPLSLRADDQPVARWGDLGQGAGGRVVDRIEQVFDRLSSGRCR